MRPWGGSCLSAHSEDLVGGMRGLLQTEKGLARQGEG